MTVLSKPGPQLYEDGATLFASAARTSVPLTASGDSAVFPGSIAGINLTFDCTAAANDAGDKLDVYVQTKPDGVNWLDVCRFVQVLGTSTGIRKHAKILAATASTEFGTSALSASQKRDVVGSEWRARYEITAAATTGNESFTFSVVAQPF